MIGLKDEYQQHGADYRAETGHEAPVGAAAPPPGVTANQVAVAMQNAMVARNSQQAVTNSAALGMNQGAFAQQVVQAYASVPHATVPAVAASAGPPPVAAQPAINLTGNLVRDLDVALPNDPSRVTAKYDTIEVFTYDSGSIMGDPKRHPDPHDHGAQPRHVREFSDIVQSVRGGTWVPEPR